MGGCQQSKAQEPRAQEAKSQAPPDEQPKVLMGSTAEQKGTPFVAKKRYHKDPVVMMCPYFKVAPDQFDAWRKNADAFYGLAKETDELLFYGMAFNEGGVHVQTGYGSAGALLAHLRRADTLMTAALQNSTLEKVEVYGPKRHLLKVKKSMTRIGDCMFQFFQTHPKIQGIRRPTDFSGQPGSDTLVTCHVSIKLTSVLTVHVLRPKIKSLHKRVMDSTGSESFCVAECGEEQTVKIVSTYDSMDATMEHLACVLSYLGADAVSGLQIHGPDSEMEKLKALMGTVAAGAEAAVAMLKAAMKSVAEEAVEDARQAKACAQAAAKAAANGVSDAVKAARDKVTSTVEALQKRAEEMAQEVYESAMKAEGATKDAANVIAKQAYSRAMEAISDTRRAADEAATKSYEAAMAAGATVVQALEQANLAAEVAAKEMHDELCEAAEAAKEASNAAAERVKETIGDALAAAQDAAKQAHEEFQACRLSMELGALAAKAQSEQAAKEARQAMMEMYEALKKDALGVVDKLYREGLTVKDATEATIGMVHDRARAASWAVVISSEHAYLAAYERVLAMGKAAEAAKEAAVKAAENAINRVHLLWKHSEQLAVDACKSAERMVQEGEKEIAKLWDCTMAYSLDAANAIRRSLSKAKQVVEAEIQEATESVAYAVSVVEEEVTEDIEEAHRSLLERLERWHDQLIEMEAQALRVVADAAEAKADKVQRTKNICC